MVGPDTNLCNSHKGNHFGCVYDLCTVSFHHPSPPAYYSHFDHGAKGRMMVTCVTRIPRLSLKKSKYCPCQISIVSGFDVPDSNFWRWAIQGILHHRWDFLVKVGWLSNTTKSGKLWNNM